MAAPAASPLVACINRSEQFLYGHSFLSQPRLIRTDFCFVNSFFRSSNFFFCFEVVFPGNEIGRIVSSVCLLSVCSQPVCTYAGELSVEREMQASENARKPHVHVK
jgi:hypothetical protein